MAVGRCLQGDDRRARDTGNAAMDVRRSDRIETDNVDFIADAVERIGYADFSASVAVGIARPRHFGRTPQVGVQGRLSLLGDRFAGRERKRGAAGKNRKHFPHETVPSLPMPDGQWSGAVDCSGAGAGAHR